MRIIAKTQINATFAILRVHFLKKRKKILLFDSKP